MFGAIPNFSLNLSNLLFVTRSILIFGLLRDSIYFFIFWITYQTFCNLFHPHIRSYSRFYFFYYFLSPLSNLLFVSRFILVFDLLRDFIYPFIFWIIFTRTFRRENSKGLVYRLSTKNCNGYHTNKGSSCHFDTTLHLFSCWSQCSFPCSSFAISFYE